MRRILCFLGIHKPATAHMVAVEFCKYCFKPLNVTKEYQKQIR